jgi:hypothetical protein
MVISNKVELAWYTIVRARLKILTEGD